MHIFNLILIHVLFSLYEFIYHSMFRNLIHTVIIIYTQTGGSRRKVVVEEKRLVVAQNEEKFQAQVFKMTTDDDMPSYSGFDFIA